MEQLEKVVKGLEFCIRNPRGVCAKECPYKMLCFYTEGETVKNRLMVDSLSLIRQQQERIKELEAGQTARVVTPEEIKDGESYWLSAAKEFTRPVICVHLEDDARNPYITFVWRFGTFSCDPEDYGKTWRCWTQRPTDEQREAVKWDE